MASANPLSSEPGASAIPSETLALLDNFWPKVMTNVSGIDIRNDFKTQELPLARIKKIMKLDEDVKMISAEAPVLFAKACEIFISELSLRAWIHTEDNKRRTLQKNDVSQAVAKYDQFDFLIDIVPRDEIKPAKREDNLQRTSLMPDQVQYYFQLAQQTQQAMQQPAAAAAAPVQAQPQQQQQIQIQTQNGQIVTAQPLQLQQLTQGAAAAQPASQVLQAATATEAQPQVIQIQAPQQQDAQAQQQQQQQQQQVVQQLQQTLQQQQQEVQQEQEQAGGTQVFQQVVTPNGEVVHMPIQLTAAQLQAIQSQMQGKQPGQPIVIQTGAEQQQQQQEAAQEQQPQPLFQVPIGSDGQQILVQEDLGQEHGEQTLTIKGEH